MPYAPEYFVAAAFMSMLYAGVSRAEREVEVGPVIIGHHAGLDRLVWYLLPEVLAELFVLFTRTARFFSRSDACRAWIRAPDSRLRESVSNLEETRSKI